MMFRVLFCLGLLAMYSGARCGHTKTCYCPDMESLLCSGSGHVTIQMLMEALPVTHVELIDLRGRTLNSEMLFQLESLYVELKLLDIRNIFCDSALSNFVHQLHEFSVLSDCIYKTGSHGYLTSQTSHIELSTEIVSTTTVQDLSNETERVTIKFLTRKIKFNGKSYNVTRSLVKFKITTLHSSSLGTSTVSTESSVSSNLNENHVRNIFLYVAGCIILVSSLWSLLLTIQCVLRICTKLATWCEHCCFVCCNRCQIVKQYFKNSNETLDNSLDVSSTTNENVVLTSYVDIPNASYEPHSDEIENLGASCSNVSSTIAECSHEYTDLFAFRNPFAVSTPSVYPQLLVNVHAPSESPLVNPVTNTCTLTDNNNQRKRHIKEK